MNRIDLEGRTAIVTGAARGLGLAITEKLLESGAAVSMWDLDAATLTAEAQRLGTKGKVHTAVVNVTDEAQVEAGAQSAQAALGRIDILVNNAGISETAPIEKLSAASWDRMIAVHLRGLFLMTRLCLPGMYERDHGKIINTASQLAYIGAPGYAHYVTAKAGIIGFTRSLALEIGTRNINANCVAPGATNTPLLDNVSPELLDQIRASIPKGRFAEVSDIVPAYVFLASDEAAFFQGQCLSPNGGDAFL